MKLAHVAVAVKDLQRAIDIYADLLDTPPDHTQEISDQNIKLALFKTANGDIELISPLDPQSSLRKFINIHGEGLHHISLRVANLSEKISALKAKGYRLIDEIPRSGAEGHKIAFLHPSGFAGVLIELEEE